MNDSDLQKLHGYHLSVLLEVDRICRKYEIGYFITGGTLLGAVRHGGFIPWDDDLDIGMLRREYERFLALAPAELPQELFLQTYTSDKGYFLPFAKLRVNNTVFVEEEALKMKTHHGVFVDLFPIDNVPKSKAMRFFHDKLTYCLKMAAVARSDFDIAKKTSAGKLFLYRTVRIILSPFQVCTVVKWCDKVLAMCKSNHSGLLVNVTGSYGYKRETFPAGIIDKYVEVNFEGHAVYTMNHWHKYLTRIYGDYMTPPPPDKRKTGHEPALMKL